ncbi:MAG: alpha/beta fold hydrolase [Bizionia sp.]|nr:alpha/beta fold hydrolase [Bizionia sp.]
MPIITSTYKPPFFTKNPHIATIYSGLFRRVRGVIQKRERVTLADGDFMDLDWSFSERKSTKLIIILHGLEGDAQRHYMLGAAKLFNEHEGDAVCVNFRGCSGEENSKFRSYHSGVAEDLEEVIKFILNEKHYTHIYLNGFSLGGNVILKYLGESPSIPSEIKGAVAISVPVHLKGSMLELHTFKNILYNMRFKRHLLDKLKRKRNYFPEELSEKSINQVKTLKDFDDVYTSKAHGFKDAYDYYKKSSSLQFLPNIAVPTLLLNALNDSFLSPECYPVKEAKANPNLYLEMPDYGGHVGFYEKNSVYYSEKRTLQFIQSI